MGKPALLACALAVIGASAALAQTSEPFPLRAISWRVDNPFRYFKDPAAARLHRAAYESLEAQLGREPTVHEIETKLAAESQGRGWVETLFPRETVKDIADAVRQDACWHRAGARCEDSYANPKSHLVRVSIPGLAGECLWSVAETDAARAPCGEETKLSIPYPGGAKVTAKSQGREVAAETIAVRDFLIVGMGDSFSSGEGNPDRAVRFDSRNVIAYDRDPLSPDPLLVGFPARQGGYHPTRRPKGYKLTSDAAFKAEAADWLHRPCHRSLYSQHLRAALHLAIRGKDQRHAVTFVHLACTGAEIVEGLFYPWSGNEKGTAEDSRVELPQISAASRAICGSNATRAVTNKVSLENPDPARGGRLDPRLLECPKDKARPIDLLLLSVGGNDVGFTGLVAGATLRLDDFTAGLAEMAKRNPTLEPGAARRLLPTLEHNYAELQKALKDILHIDDARRIVLTAYPVISQGSGGELCAAGKTGMERSQSFYFDREKARRSEAFVAEDLNPKMRQAAGAHGWTWVDRQRGEFSGHGFCAAGGTAGDKAATVMEMPSRWHAQTLTARLDSPQARTRGRRPFGGELHYGFGPGSPWKPDGYSPDQYKPYMPRARWIRTPNDAFLTVNLHEDKVPPNLLHLMRFMAYSGAFHPTAEGHAVTASAVVEKVVGAGFLDARP